MARKLVVALYGHPEAYPPTLNALRALAPAFERTSVLYRPHLTSHWSYPASVRLVSSGDSMTPREQQSLPPWHRYRLVLRFALDLAALLRRERPDVVLLYDPLALFAYALAQPVAGAAPLVWYHNHDVIEREHMKPLSLAWLGLQGERHMFPRLDLFSLPSMERETAFPMDQLKGERFFIPNFPALAGVSLRAGQRRDDGTLRLLFQGRVSAGHGLEELLSMLPFNVAGRTVHLTLVGRYDPAFRQRAEQTVRERKLEQWVSLLDFVPYAQLSEITQSCHVGIAIYQGSSILARTVATASNKIYEYAALGLPILYQDDPHFRVHLGRFSWAVPTDGSTTSLRAALEHIVANLPELAAAARRDFVADLNFERHFQPVLAFLEERLSAGQSP